MEHQSAGNYPQLLQTVLDTTEVRVLAEFYRQLLGLVYRPEIGRASCRERV